MEQLKKGGCPRKRVGLIVSGVPARGETASVFGFATHSAFEEVAQLILHSEMFDSIGKFLSFSSVFLITFARTHSR